MFHNFKWSNIPCDTLIIFHGFSIGYIFGHFPIVKSLFREYGEQSKVETIINKMYAIMDQHCTIKQLC